MSRGRALVVCLCSLAAGGLLWSVTRADETEPPLINTAIPAIDSGDDVIRQLKPLAGWVGEWRGVVQPRRGSSAGAWTEKATVSWDLSETRKELVLVQEPGRQLRRLRLMTDEKTGGLSAILESAEGNEERLSGATAATAGGNAVAGKSGNANAWVFTSTAETTSQRRVTIRLLSINRVTVLLEERSVGAVTWKRLSECGLTRSGTRLATAGGGEQQCVVTGGLGSLPVMFKGVTYYVCCEGCRQVFDDDPQGTLASYRQRLKEEGGK